MRQSRLIWYLEHRIEYLSNKRDALRKVLEQTDEGTFDYDLLREFMEIKGRLKELQYLIERLREF
jgi:hypothetical protein